MSDGIEEIGTPKWDITLCLLLAWIVVFLCICKGIRSSGKVSNQGCKLTEIQTVYFDISHAV